MSFDRLGLLPELLKSLAAQNLTVPTPVQEKAIPVVLSGKDVLGIAQTGSGKTASYVLPLLTNLKGKTVGTNREINALILVPTRELAVQVGKVVDEFGRALAFPFKSMAVFGGVSINPQMIKMQNVNVLVATPGRLLDLFNSKALSLAKVRTLILDEADKMLNLGFKKEMDKILALLPEKRQNLLFSATLSPDVKEMQQMLLHKPTTIQIETEKAAEVLIQQTAYAVEVADKGPLLRYLLKEKAMRQVLVFTSSTYEADKVTSKLMKNDIAARAIHGKKSQGSRTQSLDQFKRGSVQVLVTTDLLSRGIDIEFLPFVVNYELPRSPKDFIHRIGRTGRAEHPGEAITFVTPEDEHHFKVIQKKMKRRVILEENPLKQ